MKEVFLIAGEASGDALGAELIPALREMAEQPVHFVGVGGEQMEAAGLERLARSEDLAVMGLLEILPEIPRLWNLIGTLKKEIMRRRPAMLITIDFPDFNFLLGSFLRKATKKNPIPHVHCVAPTVWAWRPGRARSVAKFLDGMACLLPFEPPYFEEWGLSAAFVGHPAFVSAKEYASPRIGQNFRSRYAISQETKVVGLLFGSRYGEIKRCGRPLMEAGVFLRESFKEDMHFVVPTLPILEYEVLRLVGESGLSATVTTDPLTRWEAFAAMDAAMAVSGTVGLELAAVGVPHVVAYRVSRLTYEIAKKLCRVKNAHLANITLGRTVVPELLQNACEGEAIAAATLPLLTNSQARQAQHDGFAELRKCFDLAQDPAHAAARFMWARATP